MKNSIPNRKNPGRKIMFFAIFSAILIFTGCEKQELYPDANMLKELSRTAPNLPIPAVMVQIDHVSVRGTDPDYKVTLYTTGKVIFEGRKNVSATGLHYRQVDPQTVSFIRNMFLAAHFFYLPSADASMDAALYIETTFAYGTQVKTIRDLNNGTPQITLQLRNKTEALLGIGTLIDRSNREAIVRVSE